MSQSVSPPGFFGKVPARGDFLDRRMPAGFQAAWEAWLSALVVAAQSALGSAWPEGWLTAPLWHFTLGRDIVPPFGAAGVVLASVDRVGRFFPFSIIGAAAPQQGRSADDWARAAEALAIAALEDDFSPDRLDEQLRDLAPPPAVSGAGQQDGVWALPIADGWPVAPLDALSESARLPPAPGQSAWWCRGSDRMVPLHLRLSGLPGPHTSAQMVTGRFDLPGSEDLPVVAVPHSEPPVIEAALTPDPVLGAPLLPDPLGFDRLAGHPLAFDPLDAPAEPLDPALRDPDGDPLAALLRDDDPLADRKD
jgi:type VI secretion system protein ImpM